MKQILLVIAALSMLVGCVSLHTLPPPTSSSLPPIASVPTLPTLPTLPTNKRTSVIVPDSVQVPIPPL